MSEEDEYWERSADAVARTLNVAKYPESRKALAEGLKAHFDYHTSRVSETFLKEFYSRVSPLSEEAEKHYFRFVSYFALSILAAFVTGALSAILWCKVQ
jgi:hypothetical protein